MAAVEGFEVGAPAGELEWLIGGTGNTRHRDLPTTNSKQTLCAVLT